MSEATVTRFISSLGFSAFSEFKREIAERVLKDFSTTKRLSDSVEDLGQEGNIFLEILKGDIENIKDLAAKIPDQIFKETIDLLCAARSIYILGLRSSYALAFYLSFTLRFFLKKITLIKPGIGDIAEQILDTRKEDVLIVISFRRYTRESFEVAEKIKRRGVSLIAITNNRLSHIATLADKVLIAKTDIPTYIESYTAPMSLINALITAIALRMKEEAMPALHRLEGNFKEFNTFIE